MAPWVTVDPAHTLAMHTQTITYSISSAVYSQADPHIGCESAAYTRAPNTYLIITF